LNLPGGRRRFGRAPGSKGAAAERNSDSAPQTINIALETGALTGVTVTAEATPLQTDVPFADR
jgi:hypothetical protein